KALDYLRQNEPPDLIILDIAFPEMNGFEFYEVLKQNEQWAHIPILFTTALGDEENKRNATKKGTVFLEKPITIDDLFKTIDWIF
ncbi:MAG: response regulator, partial [Candidatus Thermoplasmatota archaeon]|nr:response regulator [Candidatus Thermoplasmatota archaeon]